MMALHATVHHKEDMLGACFPNHLLDDADAGPSVQRGAIHHSYSVGCNVRSCGPF